jgi:hypothetical protein
MNTQYVVKIDGQMVSIDEREIWTKPGVSKPIIRHDGVRRLMAQAGVKLESLELVINPTQGNGMRTAFLATGTNAEGRRAFAIGEADTANLQPNSIASRFPTVMAAKRAVDRLALDLLGLFELYSEIELAPQNGEGEATEEQAPPAPEPRPSSAGNGGGHSNGHSNGNGTLPPTDKQVTYIRELCERQGLTTEQAEMLVRSVRTRMAASGLIQQMKLAA